MKPEECELHLLFFWKTYFKKTDKAELNKLGGRLNQLSKDVYKHFKTKYKNLQIFFEAYSSEFWKDAHHFISLKPPPIEDELRKYNQQKGSVIFQNGLGGVIMIDQPRARVLYDIDSLSRTRIHGTSNNFKPVLHQKVTVLLPPNLSNKLLPVYAPVVLPGEDNTTSRPHHLPNGPVHYESPSPTPLYYGDSNYVDITSDELAVIANVHGKVTHMNTRAGLGYILGHHNGTSIKAYFDNKSFKHSQYPGQTKHRHPFLLFKPSDEVIFNAVQLENFLWYVTHLSCDRLFPFMKRFTNLRGTLIPLSSKFGVCHVRLYENSYYVLIISNILYQNKMRVSNLKDIKGHSITINAIEYKQVLRCTLGWLDSSPFEDTTLKNEKEWDALLQIYKSFEVMDKNKKALENFGENPSLYFPASSSYINDSSLDCSGEKNSKRLEPLEVKDLEFSLNGGPKQNGDSEIVSSTKYDAWNDEEIETSNNEICNGFKSKTEATDSNEESKNSGNLTKKINKDSHEDMNESISSMSDASLDEFLSRELLAENQKYEPAKSKSPPSFSFDKDNSISAEKTNHFNQNLLDQFNFDTQDQKDDTCQKVDEKVKSFDVKKTSMDACNKLSQSSRTVGIPKIVPHQCQPTLQAGSIQKSVPDDDFSKSSFIDKIEMPIDPTLSTKVDLVDKNGKIALRTRETCDKPLENSLTPNNTPGQLHSLAQVDPNQESSSNDDSSKLNFNEKFEMPITCPVSTKVDALDKKRNDALNINSLSIHSCKHNDAASHHAPKKIQAPFKSLLIICKDQKGYVSEISSFFVKLIAVRNPKFTFTLLFSQIYSEDPEVAHGSNNFKMPIKKGDYLNFSALIAYDLYGKMHSRIFYAWVGQKPSIDDEKNISSHIHDLDFGTPFQKVHTDIPSDSELSLGLFQPTQSGSVTPINKLESTKNGEAQTFSNQHPQHDHQMINPSDDAFSLVWDHLQKSCFKDHFNLEEEIQIKLGDLKTALYQGLAKIK